MFALKGKFTKFAVGAVAALAFFQPIGASANCAPLMADLNTFLTTQPHGPGTYQVLARMTALRSDGTYAAYGEGASTDSNDAYAQVLTYHAPPTGKYAILGQPASISDPAAAAGAPHGMQTYFSDRRYVTSTCTTCLGLPEFPFKSTAADSEGVYVQLGDWYNFATHTTIPAGAVTFTLYSWGNTRIAMVNNECTVNANGTGGLLFGFVPIPGGRQLIVLSLNGQYTPPVPIPKVVTRR
jgi:hypothetical protein